MTDYMNEAERLSRVLEDIAQTALRGVDNEQIRGHLMDASALLAHIQRGAVPEGDDGKRVLREVFALCEDTEAKCYEDPSDFNRGRSFEAKGIARAIGAWYQEEFCGRTHMGEPAAAPDHFRDAAEMVAEPAEVQRSRPNVACSAPDCGPGCRHKSPAPAEPERRIGPASDDDMVVYQSIADGYSTRAPAPAEVPEPEPADVKLYAWRPSGHGEYSFYVASTSEEAARSAVQAEVDGMRKRGGGYETSGWGTDYYTMECFGLNEVTTNDND